MEHLFRLKQRRTDIKTELAAGFTTYCSMIYLVSIIVSMMCETGMNEMAVFTSVLFASGVSCMIMGLMANYPVALAPGLGVTALFSVTICGKMGYSWQAGLCAVFVAGIAFVILALSGARKMIMMSIPGHLKNAISAGIGCFLAFTGLKNSGIIISDSQNIVGLGKIYNIEVMVSLFGLVVLLGLIISRKKFPIIKGMLATMVVGLILSFFSDSSGLPRFSTDLSFFWDFVDEFWSICRRISRIIFFSECNSCRYIDFICRLF
jgi:AGZA family xanthine/uracil permease-like MFS transporter